MTDNWDGVNWAERNRKLDSISNNSNLNYWQFCFGFNNAKSRDIFIKYAKRNGASSVRIEEVKLPSYADDIEWTNTQQGVYELPCQDPSFPCTAEELYITENYRKWSVTFDLPKGSHFNPNYYRSGLPCDSAECKLIVESYLNLTYASDIGARHFRTESAILSHLQKKDLYFYPRTLSHANNLSDEVGVDDKGNRKAIALSITEALESGKCRSINSDMLQLESKNIDSHGCFFLNDLSLSDKRKLTKYVARYISTSSAIDLAEAFNLHKLRYLLIVQQHNAIGNRGDSSDLNLLQGYISLNKCNPYLSPLLEQTRNELLNYLRSVCARITKTHHRSTSQYDRPVWSDSDLKTFTALYPFVSNEAGFPNDTEARTAIAFQARNSKYMEQRAALGDKLAQWYCCDRKERGWPEAEGFSFDPSWMTEANNISLSNISVDDCILSRLCFDKNIADSLKMRLFSQAQLRKQEHDFYLEQKREQEEMNYEYDDDYFD